MGLNYLGPTGLVRLGAREMFTLLESAGFRRHGSVFYLLHPLD